jgi:hypothetical protein
MPENADPGLQRCNPAEIISGAVITTGTQIRPLEE